MRVCVVYALESNLIEIWFHFFSEKEKKKHECNGNLSGIIFDCGDLFCQRCVGYIKITPPN